MQKGASAVQGNVAILMCTYNGARFLEPQLESFLAQSHADWFLMVSDDGSTDATLELLHSCRRQWASRQLEVLEGPARGFVENFMSVTRAAQGRAMYYAWSDQDDIWNAGKLERAISWLESVPAEVPALYCGRTLLVTEDDQELGLSHLFRKEPSFANALMQSIGGGNTMVFNQAACQLLVETSRDTVLVSHDWWAYIMVTGVGGKVFYDPEPCLRYRQHGTSAVGSNVGWRAGLARIRKMMQGRFRQWNDMHIEALSRHRQYLTPDNRRLFERYARARQRCLPVRLFQLRRCGIHRQTGLGNWGLLFAAVFRKL